MKQVIERLECSTWLRIMVAVIVGGVAGGAMVSIVNTITTHARVPVAFRKVETLNSPVKMGGALKVRAHRTKLRGDCRVESNRYATDQNGKPYDIPDRIWGGGPSDTTYFDIVYDVSSFPPGQYVLHVNLKYYCTNGMSFPVIQPTVNFRVVQ